MGTAADPIFPSATVAFQATDRSGSLRAATRAGRALAAPGPISLSASTEALLIMAELFASDASIKADTASLSVVLRVPNCWIA
jgi:hypothetical protein